MAIKIAESALKCRVGWVSGNTGIFLGLTDTSAWKSKIYKHDWKKMFSFRGKKNFWVELKHMGLSEAANKQFFILGLMTLAFIHCDPAKALLASEYNDPASLHATMTFVTKSWL